MHYERHELGEPDKRLPGTKARWRANIPTRYHDAIPPWSAVHPEQFAFDGAGVVKNYVTNMPAMDREGRGLLFTGPNGSGKTSLACRVLTESMARGPHLAHFCFASEIDWLARHRDVTTPDGHNRWELLVRDAQWLVIDDLGMERDVDWNHRWVEEVLTSRYAWKIPTIITSNISIEALDGRIPRLAQLRLDAYFHVDVNSPSWRS